MLEHESIGTMRDANVDESSRPRSRKRFAYQKRAFYLSASKAAQKKETVLKGEI